MSLLNFTATFTETMNFAFGGVTLSLRGHVYIQVASLIEQFICGFAVLSEQSRRFPWLVTQIIVLTS